MLPSMSPGSSNSKACIRRTVKYNMKCFSTALHYSVDQGRNEVRWRPGQEASLAPPCSNLRSFGSKCTVLKKVLVTLLGLFGTLRPPAVIRRHYNDSAPGVLFPFASISLRPWCRLTDVAKGSRAARNFDWGGKQQPSLNI